MTLGYPHFPKWAYKGRVCQAAVSLAPRGMYTWVPFEGQQGEGTPKKGHQGRSSQHANEQGRGEAGEQLPHRTSAECRRAVWMGQRGYPTSWIQVALGYFFSLLFLCSVPILLYCSWIEASNGSAFYYILKCRASGMAQCTIHIVSLVYGTVWSCTVHLHSNITMHNGTQIKYCKCIYTCPTEPNNKIF